MQDKQAEVFEGLFTAKLNVPQAAHDLGKTACYEEWESLKKRFREYCTQTPPNWQN